MDSHCTQRDEEPSLDKASLCYLRAYDEASKYIIRELNLINNRLTWILSIHGFLYATYGFALDNLLGYLKGYGRNCGDISYYEAVRLDLFMITITIVGMSISFAGINSINAACLAMMSIEEGFYESNIEHHHCPIVATISFRKIFSKRSRYNVRWYVSDFGYTLPHLLGGGVVSANKDGNRSSIAIPLTLLLSWVVALGVLIYPLVILISNSCKP